MKEHHNARNAHHFNTDDLKANLKERSVRGAAVTMAAQFLKLLLQIGSNVFLARLLTPNDFGLVAMVSVVATFIVMFKDMGLSQATVQRAEINHGQISTLFWINALFGFVVMMVTWALSSVIAEFYNEPKLEAITVALAFGLFIGGLTVQHQALLKRQMRFKELAIIEIASMLSGVSSGIVSAWMGYGYWALVILQIVQASVMLVGVWSFSGWRPGLPKRHTGIRSILAFGGYMTAYGFINYFARNLDTILIGWRWGAGPVGNYSRAYSLLLLPIGQITAPFSSVAVPALSRLQEEPEQFKNYYLKAVKIIAYVSMPMIVAMAVLSHEIIAIVLGSQWGTAADLFQVLAVAAFWQPVASTVGWVYVSLDNVRRMMLWGIIGTAVMVTAIVIGLSWGAYGVAVGYSVSMWLLTYPIFAFAFYGTSLSPALIFRTLWYPILCTLISGGGFILAHSLLQNHHIVTILFGTLIGGAISLFVLVVLWKPLRMDVFTIYGTLKSVLAKKRVA